MVLLFSSSQSFIVLNDICEVLMTICSLTKLAKVGVCQDIPVNMYMNLIIWVTSLSKPHLSLTTCTLTLAAVNLVIVGGEPHLVLCSASTICVITCTLQCLNGVSLRSACFSLDVKNGNEKQAVQVCTVMIRFHCALNWHGLRGPQVCTSFTTIMQTPVVCMTSFYVNTCTLTQAQCHVIGNNFHLIHNHQKMQNSNMNCTC